MAGWTLDNGAQNPIQTKLVADINITPMVDVMLVLLIIFMVTAPLLVAGVPVNLPKSTATRISQTQKPLTVTLGADGSLYIRDAKVASADFIERLAALRTSEGDAVIYVRADRTIPYGEVMALLGRIDNAGFKRISLLSQSQTQAGPAGGAEPQQPNAKAQ